MEVIQKQIKKRKWLEWVVLFCVIGGFLLVLASFLVLINTRSSQVRMEHYVIKETLNGYDNGQGEEHQSHEGGR